MAKTNNGEDEFAGATVTFRYAVELYRGLRKKARIVKPIDLIEYGYPVEDNDQEILVFEGFTAKVAETLGLSKHQKGSALSILNAMNCVTRIRTPGGGRDGLWILHYEPKVSQWEEFKNTNLRILRRTIPSRADLIVSQTKELSLKVLELTKSLEELQRRVSELESNRGHDVRKSPSVPNM